MEYNKKQFLLPNSLNSCALYHAKIMPSGEYMFRIHDCNTGIRLRGTLATEQDINEAIEKLLTLSEAAREFAEYINAQTGGKSILFLNRENECVCSKM